MNCKPAHILMPGQGSQAISSRACSPESRGSSIFWSPSIQAPPPASKCGGSNDSVCNSVVWFRPVSMVGGEGTLSDLSHYGCRMQSDIPLQPGTELELCFFPQSREAEPITVEVAIVRWAKGREFGLKFLGLQLHEEARLRHVIADLLGHSPR